MPLVRGRRIPAGLPKQLDPVTRAEFNPALDETTGHVNVPGDIVGVRIASVS